VEAIQVAGVAWAARGVMAAPRSNAPSPTIAPVSLRLANGHPAIMVFAGFTLNPQAMGRRIKPTAIANHASAMATARFSSSTPRMTNRTTTIRARMTFAIQARPVNRAIRPWLSAPHVPRTMGRCAMVLANASNAFQARIAPRRFANRMGVCQPHARTQRKTATKPILIAVALIVAIAPMAKHVESRMTASAKCAQQTFALHPHATI